MLNHIAERFQLTEEAPPGAAFTLRVGHQELLLAWHPLARGSYAAIQPHDTAGLLAALGHQGAPAADLLHVLQADDPRLTNTCPLDRHPGQVPNLFFAGLTAGGLAVVSAIRAGVEPAQAPTSQYLDWVDFPHIRLQVQGAWVIRLVHADRRRVVVDGDMDRAAQTHFQPGAGTAATGKQINIYLFVDFRQGEAVLP